MQQSAPAGVCVPWETAWQSALYGAAGFYRRQAPASHFLTATQPPLGTVLAEALWRLADLLEVSGIADVGAGRGELLQVLHEHRPERPLLGCDVLDRPEELPAAIAWRRSPGGASLADGLNDLDDVLVVAHEWLDVVPCPVAQLDESGVLRVVQVDPATGAERLGDPLDGAELAWSQQWWPATAVGERVEIGRARDLAWGDLLSRVRRGAGLAIDYGHLAGARPAGGSLTAYRGGRQVPPVPDGSCDITAHVAVDSLRHDEIWSQTTAFAQLGMHQQMPDPGLARCDPPGYLARTERAGAIGRLTDPASFGAFRWVVVRQAGAISSRS